MTAPEGTAELEARLRARAQRALQERSPGASLGPLEPLPGGISSLTFAAAASGLGDGASRVVVKVAPPGLEPVRNRDVLRQARVLEALHGARDLPVPGVLATDAGTPPLVGLE
ncbi:MAG: phosphotransferase family protein, partial [Solirubrobacteraceae bacterium]